MALQTRKPGSQAMLISETNVYPLYGERVKASLEKVGFAVSTFVFPAGEASKQLSHGAGRCTAPCPAGLHPHGLHRHPGGRRHPGTWAALPRPPSCGACPSSRCPPRCSPRWTPAWAAKPAWNLPVGKNLVGAFHQPEAVLTDPETLATLPERFFPGRHGGGHQVRLHLR